MKGVADGYEGNAQTLRIVATLTIGDTDVTSQKGFLPGLNLTRVTLGSAEVSRSALKNFFDKTFERRKDMAPKRADYERALQQALKIANAPTPYYGSQAQDCDLWSYASVLITDYTERARRIFILP